MQTARARIPQMPLFNVLGALVGADGAIRDAIAIVCQFSSDQQHVAMVKHRAVSRNQERSAQGPNKNTIIISLSQLGKQNMCVWLSLVSVLGTLVGAEARRAQRRVSEESVRGSPRCHCSHCNRVLVLKRHFGRVAKALTC